VQEDPSPGGCNECLAHPELERFVNTTVQAGCYNSAGEAVPEAPRLLKEHEQARTAQLGEFNKVLGRRLAILDLDEI
jgi:Arc/MetJ-type ribon-helix-helix transcriptional regulator